MVANGPREASLAVGGEHINVSNMFDHCTTFHNYKRFDVACLGNLVGDFQHHCTRAGNALTPLMLDARQVDLQVRRTASRAYPRFNFFVENKAAEKA